MTGISDIDLYIDSNGRLKGLDFVGLLEMLVSALGIDVDLLDNDPVYIGTGEWYEILRDENITTSQILEILTVMYNCDYYEASASFIAAKLSIEHHVIINSAVAGFSKKIIGRLGVNPLWF